jgi:hypothetical protein
MVGTHSFDDKETREDDAEIAVDEWLSDLADGVDNAVMSTEFTQFLNVMSNFHSYSRNNQLLINLQMPDATRVAGFNTWKNDFNRTVQKGETAIWIWAPMTAKKCPSCGDTRSNHDDESCANTTSSDNWSSGIVGFRTVPVFDVSQTDGEPLPELNTAAQGDATNLTDALLNATDALNVPSATVEDTSEWLHGTAKGVSNRQTGDVAVVDRTNHADKATTLAHEYAHTMLHAGEDDIPNRAAREVEAESVAYVVGRHFGLDVSGSSFYLASWAGEDTDQIEARLDRISTTAKEIIAATEDALEVLEENEQTPIPA